MTKNAFYSILKVKELLRLSKKHSVLKMAYRKTAWLER